MQAASADEATKLFGKDHPHLQMPGAWIEIIEINRCGSDLLVDCRRAGPVGHVAAITILARWDVVVGCGRCFVRRSHVPVQSP